MENLPKKMDNLMIQALIPFSGTKARNTPFNDKSNLSFAGDKIMTIHSKLQDSFPPIINNFPSYR